MVIDYKKMKVGKIYQFYYDLENEISWFITTFKGFDKHYKQMLAVYGLEKDGKISYYHVGYLDKKDWGEPDYPIEGWGFSKNDDNIEELYEHMGDPKYKKCVYFRYQGLEELTPLQDELLSNELIEFFKDPVAYFKKGRTK